MNILALLNALPGSVAQGLIWGIMAVGVYMTYKVLDLADLTVDGSIATGGATAVMLMLSGQNVYVALIGATVAGMLAGLATGIFHVMFGIPSILAGILTQLGLYSVNMRIMGKSNQAISVDKYDLILSLRDIPNAILVGVIFCAVLIVLLYCFYGTEIGRVFRNEGVDTRHNPEFTLMELYQAYTDYYGMMELTESMFKYVAQEVCGSTVIQYGPHTIDFGKPFERLTMIEAVKKYAGVDFDEIPDTAAAKKIADEKHVEYEARHEKGDILNLFFEEFVEEHLIQPTFIMDHPVEISPLTKRKPDKPDYVERFELFINGWEMCNAYSELNDPIDQRERFKAQEAALAAGDDEANTTDEDFMNALEIGMPPTGGIGYGLDRLCMLLTDSQAIRDVLFFPTMKSLDK